MSQAIKSKLSIILLSFFIVFFAMSFLVVRFAVLRPLRADFTEGQKQIDELKQAQENQSELVDQINLYRDGLYVLNLALQARLNVISGSDEENPYLVFNFSQVLDDLRRLLPRDARVVKFQVNNKGLLTVPIETVDYASLGRVLKSFKDSQLFTEVLIPSGVQRTPRQVNNGYYRYFENVYSFVIQAQLDPEFWQDPMPYSDVYKLAYYAQAIRDLTIAGTIEGYSDGTFRPDRPINRAEFFKVSLFEFLSNDEITIDEYQQYIDLSEKDWHYQYIQLASKLGIAEGDKIGRFHPEQTITRLEALQSIFNIYEIEVMDEAEEVELDEDGEVIETEPKPKIMLARDVSPDSDIYPLVKTAAEYGLLEHLNGEFRATDPITRAEVTYWVWKIKFDFLSS